MIRIARPVNWKNLEKFYKGVDGEEPRNYFLENGKIHSCAELAKGLTGREFQYVKDIEKCKDCDYGIALWDSKSAGTGENIKRLHSLGKEMKVCYSSL